MIKKICVCLLLGVCILNLCPQKVSAKNNIKESSLILNGWKNCEGKWKYYEDNKEKIGWLNISDKWYYFGIDGVMAKQNQCIDGSCYYFYNTGEMAQDINLGINYYDKNGKLAM